MTSPYQFYQFWLNLDDAGVDDYLNIYTELSENEINAIMFEFEKDKSARLAQKSLAFEATKIIHGKAKAESVKKISEALFGVAPFETLSKKDFIELANELGETKVAKDSSLVDALVTAKLASSKGEARRFVDARAVYINGTQVDSSFTKLTKDVFLQGHLLLRRGKNSQTVISMQ